MALDKITVFDPTADERVGQDSLADRLTTFDGRVVGLLNNTKDRRSSSTRSSNSCRNSSREWKSATTASPVSAGWAGTSSASWPRKWTPWFPPWGIEAPARRGVSTTA